AVTGLQASDLLRHDAALEAGIDGDLLQRSRRGGLHDGSARGLVTLERQLLERSLGGLYQSHAATGDDALLDGRLGVADGVLDAVLALLELDLGGSADLDDRDTAGQLGQALLQLLAVVVRIAVL